MGAGRELCCLAKEASGRTFEEYQSEQGSPEYLQALAEALRHDCYVWRGREWVARDAAPLEIASRRAKYKRLVEEIKEGRQLEGENFDPVSRHPTLWELRLTWETNTPLRIYFTQDTADEPTLLALEAHVKPVDVSEANIRADQNAHMDVAATRWRRYLQAKGN